MDTYLEFTSNHPLLVGALLLSFFLLVFTELRRKAAGMVNVDPQQAVKLINADAVVVDLRSADAFAAGHIVRARNIPHDELEANLGKLEKDKSKAILAVCQSGISSTKAVGELQKLGFESVYGIKGGMAAWTQAGLPVVTAKKTKSKS
jgi:rhodanese-related sulfurtransferase